MRVPDNTTADDGAESGHIGRIPLSRSQQNIYNGVLQDGDPELYLIGRTYQLCPQGLDRLLVALRFAILNNPVQLCILDAPADKISYPELLPRLGFDDIVRVVADDRDLVGSALHELVRSWDDGIHGKPLVRYTIRVDRGGLVSALEVQTHHILLDGGATGLVEADLGRFLAASPREMPTLGDGLNRLLAAHRCESAKIEEALPRITQAVRSELHTDAMRGGYGRGSAETPGSAAKGALYETVHISGELYDEMLSLSDCEHVPLNVLVTAAAVAVEGSIRQSTESLLVHAIDNRFGNPDLDVATCLVNSVGQSVRFPPFASVRDVVRSLDRGYVKAVRRRWLREEQFRRMYLAINRASHVEALTFNFLREPCAPELRPFLVAVPDTTHIGPVESLTVASVLDEQNRMVTVSIWNRADSPGPVRYARMGERIVGALQMMTSLWDRPIAMLVDEWLELGSDGTLEQAGLEASAPEAACAPAWFLDSTGGVGQGLARRRYVDMWAAWLIRNNVAPDDVVVLTDDNTDKTVDLLIACHLVGCGYSVCDTAEELAGRAASIVEHGNGPAAHIIDVAATALNAGADERRQEDVQARLDRTAQDTGLASKTAYIMPTSGSTGPPKLVRIKHGSLATFCDAVRKAYGWGPDDIIMQSAPLTSDISVEEVFGAVSCGAELVRTSAMRIGDLPQLVRDLVAHRATVIDLPTAIWHLLGEDDVVVEQIGHSNLRQVIIGGEAVRSSAVDKWIDSFGVQRISLISTYGPTEATVVATYLPIVGEYATAPTDARLRVGRPMVLHSVFIAFGEIVILGDLVASSYLGMTGGDFGVVVMPDGSHCNAFATADRIAVDSQGFPTFAGRRDALVKVSGRRVDTAALARLITDAVAVKDLAVELVNGRLGVWFHTDRTRAGGDDDGVGLQIRRILKRLGVPSFFVAAVSRIPRKSNGKIDSANLTLTQSTDSAADHTATGETASGLAAVWSQHLDRIIGPESSLLDEGVGSLDLIKILPDTRQYLGRHVSILDLISADTASNLVDAASVADTWMDAETVGTIEDDFNSVWGARKSTGVIRGHVQPGDGRGPIVVLGSSGVLGTGFAQAVLDLKREGRLSGDVVFVTRTALPQVDPWTTLCETDGVRIDCRPGEINTDELSSLIRDLRPRTVINCIGNTNVVVPYRDLRPANVELVSKIIEVCLKTGTRLVHLSTFVVNADAAGSEVTDPREAPYPYAASKSLAELAVAGSSEELDYIIVRLPRVLGSVFQLSDTADILVSVKEACAAIGAVPIVPVTEEVTTAPAAAAAVMGLLTPAANLGSGIAVVRGEPVNYTRFLSEFASEELDVTEWKRRLDHSDWATENPRRWSVIDAWVTLGLRLGDQSYADYLGEFPTVALGIESVVELPTAPQLVRDLLIEATCDPRPTRDAGRN